MLTREQKWCLMETLHHFHKMLFYYPDKANTLKQLSQECVDLYNMILNPRDKETEQQHTTRILTKQAEMLKTATLAAKNATIMWRMIGINPNRKWTESQLIIIITSMRDSFVKFPEVRMSIINLLLYRQPLPEVKLHQNNALEWDSVKEWAKQHLSEPSPEQTSKNENTNTLAQTEAAHTLLKLGHVEGGDTQSSAGEPAGEPAPKRLKV